LQEGYVIRTQDGLRALEGRDGTETLIFEDERADLCISCARKRGYRRIDVSSYYGYKARNLKPVMPLSDFVEELLIGQSSDKSKQISYEGLGEFCRLKLLSVPDNGKDTVDLSSFPNLRTLLCNVTKRLKGLETCTGLEWLGANSFNSQTKDLTSLPPLPRLRHLTLGITNVVTLDGIDRFASLRELEVYRASKLQSIAALRSLSDTLEEVEINICKRVGDFEVLGQVRSLRKLMLSDSGAMESLAWVRGLPHLEFLSFVGTKVVDGDLSCCDNIGYCGFDDKRHYNRRFEQLRKRP
jgi:hypothetical protein